MSDIDNLESLFKKYNIGLNKTSEWFKIFDNNFDIIKEVFRKLEMEEKIGYEICPSIDQVFRCFEDLDIDDVYCVFLGEDPYPNMDEAIGKSFCYPENQKIPKSARYIRGFSGDEEIEEFSDKEFSRYLDCLSKNGVLFLNSALTIGLNPNNKKDKSKHFDIWEDFFSLVIEEINDMDDVLFVGLGNEAINKLKFHNIEEDNMECSSHPSWFSYSKRLKSGYCAFKDAKILTFVERFLNEKTGVVIDKGLFREKDNSVKKYCKK